VFSCFSLIVTGECNFNCNYCYQDKDDLFLTPAAVEKAIRFFFPHFDRECAILFCGGEPLLRMDAIRAAVGAAAAENRRRGKKITYSISTNGSLLDDDILAIFDEHRFTVLLSYDGLAQDKGRKEGTSALVAEALSRLLQRPGIELLTNSVFTPETVVDLSASIRDIVERGVRDVQISFATHDPWGEEALSRLEAQLSELRRFLVFFARRTGRMPVSNFGRSAEAGIFGCLAGENRMALAPDGSLWGCHLFYDFHKKIRNSDSVQYCFGPLESYMANHQRTYPRTLRRYADLRMDYFHTPRKFCGSCRDVHDCVVCPVDAAFSSGIIGRIVPADCQVRKVVRKEKKLLWEDLENHGVGMPQERARMSKRRVDA
jgi:sulfatase maturation enzyme AslB (radical SAM superfamily)